MIAKSILYIAACLSIALIVSSCATKNTTLSEAPAATKKPDPELEEVVLEFLKSVESNDREKSRSLILEPDKSYNPDILKELRSKSPADPPSNSSSNRASSKGKSTVVGIPVRQDWFAVFREEHYEFGRVLDQTKDDEHPSMIVQLKDSRVGLAQNFKFSLKNEGGQWLIADIAWEGDSYLLNPPLPKTA